MSLLQTIKQDGKKLYNSPGFFVIVFGAILIITLLLLTTQINSLLRQGNLHPYGRHHPPAQAGEFSVAQVEPWMTFSYLNVVFKLPGSYLQKSLLISDKRYPNISIRSYAGSSHETTTQAIEKIQQAILTFKHQPTSTP